jgi:hypothetical protein
MVRRPCLLQSARARVVEHEVISVDIVARLISPPTLIISVCVPVRWTLWKKESIWYPVVLTIFISISFLGQGKEIYRQVCH